MASCEENISLFLPFTPIFFRATLLPSANSTREKIRLRVDLYPDIDYNSLATMANAM